MVYLPPLISPSIAHSLPSITHQDTPSHKDKDGHRKDKEQYREDVRKREYGIEVASWSQVVALLLRLMYRGMLNSSIAGCRRCMRRVRVGTMLRFSSVFADGLQAEADAHLNSNTLLIIPSIPRIIHDIHMPRLLLTSHTPSERRVLRDHPPSQRAIQLGTQRQFAQILLLRLRHRKSLVLQLGLFEPCKARMQILHVVREGVGFLGGRFRGDGEVRGCDGGREGGCHAVDGEAGRGAVGDGHGVVGWR